LDISLLDMTHLEDDYFQLKVNFETCDSMGANFINSVLEEFGRSLKNFVNTNDSFVEEEKELTALVENVTGWTIEVEEYEDKESLMDDFKILKSRGLKAYIQYKDNEDNKFILYVGPTIDRDDSRDNLTKISDLTRFSPKIIPYD